MKRSMREAILVTVVFYFLILIGIGVSYIVMGMLRQYQYEKDGTFYNDLKITYIDDDDITKSIRDMGDIDTPLYEQGKRIYINVPTSECDESGYVSMVQENANFLIYEDNLDRDCTSFHKVYYFRTEEYMTLILSGEKTEYPLEKYVSGGIEYEYILMSEDDNGSSMVYQKAPVISVGGYNAFRILSLSPGKVTTFCVFDISLLSSEVVGYVVFGGVSDIEVDYCSMLDDTQGFEIAVI